jgi:argininosuccinate lyase
VTGIERQATNRGVMEPHQLWGGRFRAASREALVKLNDSLPVDLRLWPYDVRAAKAWVSALAGSSVVDREEEQNLLDGLDGVARRLEAGEGENADDEDVHTLVERLLYEEVGDLAGKLNTGRSRNDQVMTDLRLWCMDAAQAIDAELVEFGRVLVSQAKNGVEHLLPGYTHGQRAQPVRWAYVLLAHTWPLTRDRSRLAEAAMRLSELPLGSAALAGSGIAVDRARLKVALGFERLSPNGLDATGTRDFVAELLCVLGLIATHISRLAGELMIYASSEYGFIRLSDGYCTGSSLLPQKRNPDVLELARAKSSRVLGDLVGMLSVMRGLPAGYSKDLQEDKSFLFDAVDTVLLTLPAISGAVKEMEPIPENMAAALDNSMLATDLADQLVVEGVPFREAHRIVGNLVRTAESLGVPLTDVPSEAASTIHSALPRLVAGLGNWHDSIERRATAGGSSKPSVEQQLELLDGVFGERNGSQTD